MKKRRTKTILAAFAVLIMVAASTGLYLYNIYYRDNIMDREARIFVDNDDTADSIAVKLDRSGILKSYGRFIKASSARLDENKIKPGCYAFRNGGDNRYIINSIMMGWQTPVRITISGNIRDFGKLSSILSEQVMADSSEIAQAFSGETSNPAALGKIIPETYEVYWTITPDKLIDRLHEEYGKFWNEGRISKCREIDLSPEEVSTLASIVAEESNKENELPVIAGVYMNRLKRGIPLQADPTVKFALGDPSIKRILYKHLEIDSPYNTYKHTGLPPGPIIIPPVAAIDAVLNYTRHDYMYFCANASLDGTHKFAKSHSEHIRNAREYQKAISALGL